MKIGILQCGHARDAVAAQSGDYFDMFKKLLEGQDLTFEKYNVVDMEFPANIHECDGWLLSGSRHGVYDDLPFISPLEDFVREAYAAGVPLVGICFGHQLIAQALGGKVIKFPAGWSIGHEEYRFDDGGKVCLNAWHQDQVVEVPAGGKTIASTDFCAHAAITCGDRAFTLQPHPEFSNSIMGKMLEILRGTGDFTDAQFDAAEAKLSEPTDHKIMADRIGRFFQNAREAAHV